MNVRELIDILKDYPEDTEVELAIACAVEKDEQIAVDRYPIDGVLPWDDNDDDEEAGDDADEKLVIWLVGGEEEDVDAFMDAIEDDSDDDDA
jgi:hypothetical protein